MKGACTKCGCTENKPCFNADGPRPCGWVDDQEDLCDRCAALLITLPIEPVDLAESTLVIRALRALVIQSIRNQDLLAREVAALRLAADPVGLFHALGVP